MLSINSIGLIKTVIYFNCLDSSLSKLKQPFFLGDCHSKIKGTGRYNGISKRGRVLT